MDGGQCARVPHRVCPAICGGILYSGERHYALGLYVRNRVGAGVYFVLRDIVRSGIVGPGDDMVVAVDAEVHAGHGRRRLLRRE